MIALLTTSRKALFGGVAAFLTPLYVLLQSGQDITWRVVMACLVGGLLSGLAVWAGSNDPAVPYGEHAVAKTQPTEGI